MANWVDEVPSCGLFSSLFFSRAICSGEVVTDLQGGSFLCPQLCIDTDPVLNADTKASGALLINKYCFPFLDDRRRDRRRRRRRNRIRGNNSAASGTETDTSVSNYRQDRGPRQPPAPRGGPNRPPGQVKSEDNATQALATSNGAGSRSSHPTANGGGGEDGSTKASKSDSQQSAPKDQRPVRRPPPTPSAQSKAGANQLSGSDSDTKAKGKTGSAPKSKEHIVNGE